MRIIKNVFSNRNSAAWFLLVFSVALHVTEEALTDFLPFYNQTVLRIRETFEFFPAPTFSFEVWIGGLIGAVILGFCLTPLINRNKKFMWFIMMIISILMVINGLIHISGSVYYGRILPGMWSSPVLIAAALYVFYRAFKWT